MHCVPMGPWDTTILSFSQINKFLVTLILIQLLRKCTGRHLWVSAIHTVSLKEIE